MNEQKHLGLILDSCLSFEKHLDGNIKAQTNLVIIKDIKRFLSLETLDQMCKAVVRSHLNYCDIVYHIPSKQDQLGGILMEKVEIIEYQAAPVITGAWQDSNRSKLYDELGSESLPDQRWCR